MIPAPYVPQAPEPAGALPQPTRRLQPSIAHACVCYGLDPTASRWPTAVAPHPVNWTLIDAAVANGVVCNATAALVLAYRAVSRPRAARPLALAAPQAE